MAQLPDGSWLAAYMYATSPNRIRVKRSFDNMRTWQFATEIVESGRDLDNPSLALLPSGSIALAIRSVIANTSYYIETYVSNDQGNTFQYQSQVDWNHSGPGVYEPHLYVLPGGALACFYANENHQSETPGYSQTLSEKVSQDGGYTWGPEVFAVAQPGAARPGTANLVALPGGVLSLFYEVCGTEDCKGHVSYSSDGVTWAGAIGPVVPETYQDVEAIGMSNGLVLATSNLRDIVVSTDFTNSWHDPQIYASPYGLWPGIYETGPNEFAVVLTSAGPNGEVGQYIRFGAVDPTAFQFPSSGVCKGPTNTRPQNCR